MKSKSGRADSGKPLSGQPKNWNALTIYEVENQVPREIKAK